MARFAPKYNECFLGPCTILASSFVETEGMQDKQSGHTERLDFLHKDLGDHKKKMEEIVDDLENRARRQNLRLIGFPEGVEGKNAEAILQEWLPRKYWAWRPGS